MIAPGLNASASVRLIDTGFKMIGVGELVAGELLGESSKLLEPFRFSRYAQGKLHPVSNSPFPWS